MSSFMKWWVMILSGSRELETYFEVLMYSTNLLSELVCYSKVMVKGSSKLSAVNLWGTGKENSIILSTLMNRVKSIVRHCFCTRDDQLPASISVLFVVRYYSRHSSFRISRFPPPVSVCYCWLDSTFADWFIEKEEIPGNGISSS